jgi:hypothetical protein
MLNVVAISDPSRNPRSLILRSSEATWPSSMKTSSSPARVKSISEVMKVALTIRLSFFAARYARVAESSVPPRQ